MDLRQVPDREDLIDQLRRANHSAWAWLASRGVAIVVLAFLIRWDRVMNSPIISITACLVIIGPFVMSVLGLWGQKKKRIEDVKETTKFGEHDKFSLQTLFQTTLKKLRLQNERLPLYITSDKSLNAGAVRLGKMFGRLNGIYLNRQILHRLSGEEIQSIMGHELGHYYRFNLIGDRFRLLTLLLGAFVGLFVAQVVGVEGLFGFVILSIASTIFWVIDRMSMMRHGRAIEYLCDDYGAQVNGIGPSISGLLKAGLDAEMRYSLELEILAKHAGNELLAPREISEAIEKAIPYGQSDEVEMYDNVRDELKRKAQANRKVSISGFIRYVWESDADDDEDIMEELQRRARQINQIQRLEWESLFDDPQNIEFHNEAQIERLVDLILQSPGQSMLRIPNGGDDGVHPPLANRILYLWKNRSNPVAIVI